LRQLVHEFRRWMFCTYRGRFDLPLPATEWRHVWCLLLPGYSFRDAGWPRLGRYILYLWIIALLLFLGCLGYAPANWAFAVMLSLHVTSVMYLVNRTSPEMSIWRRLVVGLAALFLIGQVLYGIPLRWTILPLQHGGDVFVVYRMPAWAAVKRGELVAYHTQGAYGTVRVHDGYVLSRVLARPGDTVTFDNANFRVNDGPATQRLDWMPRAGSVTLAENRWLIWPELDTLRHVNVTEDQIARAVLHVAEVRRAEIIGKPFRRWFWREQTL
jgi:hypothetical protein